MSAHVLSTSKMHATGVLVESCGERCGSMVLTAACYWPPSHCIPAQMFVFVPLELKMITVHRGCWTPTRMCAVTNPLCSVCELER